MKKVLEDCAIALKRHGLITPSGKFLLAELEAGFIVERANGIRGEGWKPFNVAEYARDILKDESDRSGIPVYHIADYVLRIMRDTKLLSGDKKGPSARGVIGKPGVNEFFSLCPMFAYYYIKRKITQCFFSLGIRDEHEPPEVLDLDLPEGYNHSYRNFQSRI